MPRKHRLNQALMLALASTIASSVHTQEATQDEPRQLETVVVQGEIVYRDRTSDTAPVLSYDLEYFQRFEPLTVGDMLKRVPSVAFVSDVLEYDGARLRGLAPAYTQILINGKPVPGAGDDRSFFVDRIPAELVERIEIVRSSSANRSGDAIAGALNIVLRDAYEFDGAYARLGALSFDDGELKETYGGVASGEFAGGRLLGGLNVQGRYNPKIKRSVRFDEPGGDFDNREDQDDTRDGRDYSGNFSFVRDFGANRLTVDGHYVRTDRTETENSFEYNDPVSSSRNNLLSINNQVQEIDQDNYGLNGELELAMAGGVTAIDLHYSRFDNDELSIEQEAGFDDDDTPPSFDELEGQFEQVQTEDSEFKIKLAHVRPVGAAEFEFGIDLRDKQRDNELLLSEVSTDEEGELLPAFTEFDRIADEVEEQRIDPYLMYSGGDALKWEVGLRLETTEADITIDNENFDNDYDVLLPSAHLRWAATDADQFRFSLARSVRRPAFNELRPVLLEGEFGDNDFIGNPALDPEIAAGFDIGYERRLGQRGVFGVNIFYRDVDDLIELVNTGEPSQEAIDDFEDEVEEFLDENPGATPATPGYPEFDPSSFVYSIDNVGDGTVFGIEFDLSTPLDFIGLPDTGLFANYSWLDSEVDDALGERTFNDQARHVYNVGFIHDLPDLGATFGLSYRKQGDAFSRVLAEEVRTRYDGDLEAFIEKRFGERFSLRLTASNLLDASKDEDFNKFDNLEDQIDRDFDEFELETETAGPAVQLIGRYSF